MARESKKGSRLCCVRGRLQLLFTIGGLGVLPCCLVPEESKDEDKVKEFIARFSACSLPANGGEAEIPQDAEIHESKVELGRAPPCELYAQLKPFCVLEQTAERYHQCTLPAHVKDRCLVFFACVTLW